MIIHNGNEDPYKYHQVLLMDPHEEYASTLQFTKFQRIWKPYQLTEAVASLHGLTNPIGGGEAEEIVDKAFKMLFGTKVDEEWRFSTIWSINGTWEELDHAFRRLATALNVDGLGGDDDAFDYWPNTMDMLYDLANDMAELGQGTKYQDWAAQIAYEVYTRVTEAADDIEEAKKTYKDEWNYPARWAVKED